VAKYSREIVADVLAATDIVEVLGASVELKPSGSGRFKALCPFHNEKTPSFSVSRDRQMFYCFGCQKSGDAITFLCEYEGLSFIEALRKLADRAGIRLPALTERDNKEDYQRARLLEFGKFAAGFFTDTLNDPLKGGRGRQYLKTRQLKSDTVKQFGLGYAPDGWSNLVDAARAAGFKDALLEVSGLAKRGDRGTVYDFFRNRLMFPIRDVAGNRVAFGGRDLGDSPAKYVNSPESPVYKKGRVLYGLFEARDAMRREKHVILVEGYFDLLRCFDEGLENVLATCGTALTPNQAKLIRRYVPEVVVVFDGDAAGVRAALRGIAVLSGAGLAVRALLLPDGQDPDDFIRQHGPDAFRSLVSEALDFVTFYVRGNAQRLDTIEGRTEVAQEIFTTLANITDALRRDEYLKRAAKELDVDPWICREEFSKFLRRQTSHRTQQSNSEEPVPRVSPQDRNFIATLLHNGTLLEKTQTALADVALEPGTLVEVLKALFDGVGPDAARRLETNAAQGLYAAAVNCDRKDLPENPENLVKEHIMRLKKSALLAEDARILEAIREAEQGKDQARIVELMARKGDLRRQIEAVSTA